jgi:hypothetical protein
MRGYQIDTMVVRDDYRLIDLRAIASTSSALAVEGRRDRTVPAPPGHARTPNAYPPNRRRRR